MHYSTLTDSRLLRRSFALVATLFCGTASLLAQNSPAPAATPPVTSNATPSVVAIVETMYEHDFSAGIKGTGNGEMSVDRFGLGAKTTNSWGDVHFVDALSYSYNHYDFSGVPDPFSSVNKLGGTMLASYNIDAQWGVFGYLGAEFAADSTTNFFDGGQVAIAAGPSYKFDENLTISVGPMIYTRLEDTTTWTIYAEANWKFLPQWELHAFAGTSNGVTVAYDIFNNQQTVADATVEYNSHWIQLSAVPGGDRSVNETNVELKLGVRQIFLGNYFARGYVSLLLDRTYQFHVNGQSANSADVENALGIGFELGAAF